MEAAYSHSSKLKAKKSKSSSVYPTGTRLVKTGIPVLVKTGIPDFTNRIFFYQSRFLPKQDKYILNTITFLSCKFMK